LSYCAGFARPNTGSGDGNTVTVNMFALLEYNEAEGDGHPATYKLHEATHTPENSTVLSTATSIPIIGSIGAF
jgi:hypothetical protein